MYLYKQGGGGKFYIGPPWDFDAWTFGYWVGPAIGYEKLEVLPPGISDRYWTLNSTVYFKELFEDPVFVKRLKEKWKTYRPILESEIPRYIDERYELIHLAAERNDNMWPVWDPRWNYPKVSYKQCVQEMKENFMSQLDITDSFINSL